MSKKEILQMIQQHSTKILNLLEVSEEATSGTLTNIPDRLTEWDLCNVAEDIKAKVLPIYKETIDKALKAEEIIFNNLLKSYQREAAHA